MASQRTQARINNLDNPESRLNKKIIQYMFSKGCVKADVLLVATQNVMPRNASQELDPDVLNQKITRINSKLKKYDLMIRSTMDEITTKKYYVLISLVDNMATRASTLYNPKELELFKLILESIVKDPNGFIPRSELKTLGVQAFLKPPEANKIFMHWRSKDWFVYVYENDTECITLGVRALAELDVFIKQKLVEDPKTLDCKGCNNMTIYSDYCSTCGKRYHKRCAKMYLDKETKLCQDCQMCD